MKSGITLASAIPTWPAMLNGTSVWKAFCAISVALDATPAELEEKAAAFLAA
jgi:hypothetical protein